MGKGVSTRLKMHLKVNVSPPYFKTHTHACTHTCAHICVPWLSLHMSVYSAQLINWRKLCMSVLHWNKGYQKFQKLCYIFFVASHSEEGRFYKWMEKEYVKIRPEFDQSQSVPIMVKLTLFQVLGLVGTILRSSKCCFKILIPVIDISDVTALVLPLSLVYYVASMILVSSFSPVRETFAALGMLSVLDVI